MSITSIPGDWVHLVRSKGRSEKTDEVPFPECSGKKSKRRATNSTYTSNVNQSTTSDLPNKRSRLGQDMPPQSVEDVCRNILSSIYAASKRSGEVEILNLDPILSTSSYRNLVENLFNSSSDCVAPVIPVISKAYEESFMREPIHASERTCVMGDKCECNFISSDNGFIAVEFLLPHEVGGKNRQTCVLCHRRTVQTLFYDLLYVGRPFKGIIQRYGNITSVVGEYRNDVMLVCPIGGQCYFLCW